MAKLKLYPQGLTAGIPGRPPQNRGIKQRVSGWSATSTRSLVRFLYSVDFLAIDQDSEVLSYTVTVRDCPSTPDDWKRLREAFFRAIHRATSGAFSLLWLTEWQRRGVPHLHGIVILPWGTLSPSDLVSIWCRVAAEYRPEPHCQTVREIYDAMGWFDYLAKHSARGITHYQRSSAGIPRSWKEKTGRMWGHRGNFPTQDPIPITCDRTAFYRIRRILRNMHCSHVRARQDWKSLTKARRSLRHSDRFLSSRRGVSAFLPHDLTLLILNQLRDDLDALYAVDEV